jgi:hypothetical protein
MNDSNQFMMLFRFKPNPSYQPTEAELEAQHQAWGSFIGNLAIQEKLVSTHQLGFSGNQLHADHSITDGVYTCEQGTLGGNMIVKAKNLEEATEMAKDSPILKMGGTVEIRDIRPM